jgi:hypothetical protein
MPGEFPFPEKTFKSRKHQIGQILWTLHLDGPFTDQQEGRATALFQRALNNRGIHIEMGPLNHLLRQFEMDRDGSGTHGQYAPEFDYIARQIEGKRTYEIRLAVDPNEVPFPPNPFRGTTKFKALTHKSRPAPAQDVPLDEGMLNDPIQQLKAIQNGHAGDEVADTVLPPETIAVEPAVAAETAVSEVATSAPTLEDGSASDCILVAMSLLNQANLKLLTQPLHDVRSMIGTEVAEMRRLSQENDDLRKRVRELENEKINLMQVNAQLDTTMHALQRNLASANGVSAGATV